MNLKNVLKLLCFVSCSFLFCSCGAINEVFDTALLDARSSDSSKFLSSGSILVSRLVPSNDINIAKNNPLESEFDYDSMNQLLGYFQPSEDFSPAFNETWLEINTKKNTASLMQGSLPTEVFPLEGALTANAGQYYIRAKELNPLWLAPESYFSKRGLNVPEERFRSGAFGDMAIFTTSDLVIHSAPFWTPEVGGLRMTGKKLSKVFSSLPLGSPIIVR